MLTPPPRVRTAPLEIRSSETGRFELPMLPDGDYELVARHRLLGKTVRRLAINGKKPRPVTFVFDVPERLRARRDGKRKR